MTAIQKATQASAANRIGRPHQLTQALDLQFHCFKIATQGKLRADRLASLVRSWCAVTECIRVIRGIPSPGQLRPDLDPAQAMKALKRIRERLPVDIGQAAKSAIADGPEPAPEPRTPTPTKVGKRPKATEPCQPLQTSSLTDQPENPLNKPPNTEALEHESALDLPDDEAADAPNG